MDPTEEQIFSNLEPNVLAAGLFGSRARGDAMEHSDYDIILITPFECGGKFYFIPEDTLAKATNRICIFYRTPGQALNSLYGVDEDWPVRNAPFIHNRIVFDTDEHFTSFRKTKDSLPPDLFHKAFAETLYHAFEYLGKLKNMGHPIRTMEAARRFTDKLCKATALRNRHVFKDYCHYFPEIEAMEWVPRVLRSNMRGMAGYEGWDAHTIAVKCIEAWDDYIGEAGLVPRFTTQAPASLPPIRRDAKATFSPASP